jgi:hypothetical protein
MQRAAHGRSARCKLIRGGVAPQGSDLTPARRD